MAMPAAEPAAKTYTLRSASNAVLGFVRLESPERWELLDAAHQSGYPRRIVDLSLIFQSLARGRAWVEPGWAADQASGLLEQARQTGYVAYLLSLVQQMPAALCEMMPGPSQRRAALASVFAQIAHLAGDPRLLQTQWGLEKLTYLDLATVYEGLAPDSPDADAVRQGQRAAFRVWQTTITDDQRAWFFGPQSPAQERELAMLELLSYQAPDGRRLHRLFREDPSAREGVVRLIERWYLQRYDLSTAEQFKTALRSLEEQPAEQSAYLDAAPARAFCWAKRSEGLALAGGVVYLLAGMALAQDWVGGAAVQRWSPVLVALLYLLCGLPPLWFWLTSGRPDTSTPKLLAGILVALLGIVLQQNWESLAWFAADQPLAVVLLFAGFLIASYKVLLTKIYRSTGYWHDNPLPAATAWQRLAHRWRSPPHQRCRTVWLRGLAISFLLSLLLTDLLGDYYVQCSDCAIPVVAGLVGHTYPGLVALFTPLLLFAGIFTQLIWQDSPITEALL